MEAASAITAEVVRNALSVAAEEGSVVVVRSSHSTNIQEGADAAAAVLDAAGRLIAQSASTTVLHSASLRCGLQALLAEVPLEQMQPGDILALNDPYRGGIHANDIMLLRPVFAGRPPTPRWFAGTLIHVADVGGAVAGGLGALATDTFAEGVLLPPVWLFRRGEPNRDVLGIIERNSRAPAKVIGDVHALVAGVNVISKRLDELAARYGADELDRLMDGFVAYARQLTSAGLDAIPAGTYTGRYTIDGDGIDPARTFEVHAAVTVGGGRAHVDFAGTSPQSQGAINASISQTLSGVIYAVRGFLDPTIPMNEGCFDVITATLPRGTLVNPAPPAACGGRVATVTAAVEAIIGALSTAVPDHAIAPSALIHVYTLSGRNWLTLGYEFGGIGARHGEDGPDATGAYFLGGRSVIPQIEPLEAQLPFVVERWRLIPGSGGPGRWRGGDGVEMALRMTAPGELTVRGYRMAIPPPGAGGGGAGRAGRFRVVRASGAVEELAPLQQGVQLDPGDVFVLETSGGGGLGPPPTETAGR